MTKPWQIETSKLILRIIYDSDNVSINEDGFLKIGDKETSIEATIFLNLQQPETSLHDPDYRKTSTKLTFHITLYLIQRPNHTCRHQALRNGWESVPEKRKLPKNDN